MSFPRYPKYKDSGVEWLGEVPDTWELARLGHFARESRVKVSDTEWPPLSVTKNGVVPQLDTAAKSDDNDNRKRVRKGEYVINGRSDRKGSSGIAKMDGSVSLINIVLELFDIEGRFAHHLFRSTSFQEEFYRFGKGIVADLWSTGFAEMSDILLAVPTLAEQTMIATFLDQEIDKIDALIEEQRRLVELLKEKRQAVISHAVTKGLDPQATTQDSHIDFIGLIPSDWLLLRVKDCCLPADGIQMGPFGGMLLNLSHESTGYKVYGQQNTISGDFLSGTRWVTAERFEELNSYRLERGDIVLTRKGSLGNARYIEHDIELGIIDSDTIRLRAARDRLRPAFLSLLLHEARYLATQLEMYKRGAILSGLNSRTIGDLLVVVPPTSEQDRILKYLQDELIHLDCIVDDVESASGLLQERRSALIAAAVTGKIDVRNYGPQLSEVTEEMYEPA